MRELLFLAFKEERAVELADAQVCRSGRTARTWNAETKKVELDPSKEGLRLDFAMQSKGGGVTEVKLTIGPRDFSSIVATMVLADRTVAIREMAAAVAKELENQASHDSAKIRSGRLSVVEAADRACQDAPNGRDHAERLMKEMVIEMVDKLNKEDKAKPTRNGAN
jgi:hypothetical protein